MARPGDGWRDDGEQGDLLSGQSHDEGTSEELRDPDRAPESTDAGGTREAASEETAPPPAPSSHPASGAPESDAVDGGGGGRPAPRRPARRGGPEPTADRLTRARTLVERGRVEEAIELYRTVVSENPTHLKARHNLGVLYDELGRHELAVEQLEAARDLEPENVEVLTNLGSALAAAGRFDDSERELRRAQRLGPESVDVRAALGVLFFRRGLYPQAEAELRWVCEKDDAHLQAHIYRGEALNRLGRVEQAIDVLERVVQLQPDNAKAYYTLGILFDRKHMKDEAARMYRKSREVSAS